MLVSKLPGISLDVLDVLQGTPSTFLHLLRMTFDWLIVTFSNTA